MKKDRNNEMNHTFVICAYMDSPFLEECILSLQNQTVSSKIICTTSTPSPWLEEICGKYGIPYYVNDDGGGITKDWNFAIAQCDTKYVTIAHQDDVYYEQYTETILNAAEQSTNPIILFSDYNEIRNDMHSSSHRNLKIKRMLLRPLRRASWAGKPWVRRRVLSLGNPICCPSVTFNRENTPKVIFRNHFRSNCDWEAWNILSRRAGQFVYIPHELMGHRIHQESTTSEMIRESARSAEDYEMFCKFWPRWFAGWLTVKYSKSEDANTV